MTLKHHLAVGVGLAALCAASAQAAPVQAGWQLQLNGDYDMPSMTLTNVSDSSVDLARFAMTIGEGAYGYDYVEMGSAPDGGTATLTAGETPPGDASTTDSFAFEFTDFDPGETATWTVDIDSGRGEAADYRSVLFNNGGATPNAVIDAAFQSPLFLDGNRRTVVGALSDYEGVEPVTFTFSEAQSYTSVPTPAALPLLGSGLVVLGFAVRRRQRA